MFPFSCHSLAPRSILALDDLVRIPVLRIHMSLVFRFCTSRSHAHIVPCHAHSGSSPDRSGGLTVTFSRPRFHWHSAHSHSAPYDLMHILLPRRERSGCVLHRSHGLTAFTLLHSRSYTHLEPPLSHSDFILSYPILVLSVSYAISLPHPLPPPLLLNIFFPFFYLFFSLLLPQTQPLTFFFFSSPTGMPLPAR